MNPDKGAHGAYPTDWDGKVLQLQSQKDGHVYACTIQVYETETKSSMVNVIGVDMRNILPNHPQDKFAGHTMYCEYNHTNQAYHCFNSWGTKNRTCDIAQNEPSTKAFLVWWSKIVRLGYNERPD